MIILVQNNLFLLPALDLPSAEILYAPIYHTRLQKNFIRKRFGELRAYHPRSKWCEAVEIQSFDLALAWDALYEKNAFVGKLHPRQNHLFDQLPFELPKSFTPFHVQAQRFLPILFPTAIPPYDREVIAELDYYFREKLLPHTYLETRNDLTGRDGSTKLSAFLSTGVLDVRYLYNEIRNFELTHGASKSTGHLIYELIWREFFYWHYQKFPREYFSKNGIKGPLDHSWFPDFTVDALRSMKAHPFFRAALNELEGTGFLSNRARQIFASIWINELKLDWRSGARLFEDYLIDYDVYSNYGNWMYLAGVGVDPRGKRVFNVDLQLETYDPDGKYLRAWS